MDYRNFPALIAILFLSIVSYSASQNPLNFSLYVTSTPGLTTTTVTPAVESVLQLIRDDPYLLNGYSLQLTQTFDTMCDLERTVEEFTNEFKGSTKPIALVDGGCTQATQEIAKANNSTVLLVFSSTSLTFRNNTIYRTIPSDQPIPSSLNSLMTQYEWNQLSVVTIQQPQYQQLDKLINEELDTNRILETILISDDDELQESIDALFAADPRIYFLNTDPKTAVYFLCQAYQRDRYYPDYLWLTLGWYEMNWWTNQDLLNGTTCVMSDIATALNRSLAVNSIPIQNGNIDGVPVFNTTNIIDEDDKYSTSSYAVDAVLSLALALNASGAPPGGNYDNLVNALSNVQFYGASGFVSYDNNGDRDNIQVSLQQYTSESDGRVTLSEIALINNNGLFRYIPGFNDSSVFPDGIPPDGTHIKIVNTILVGVSAFVVILFVTGLIIAVICLFFNIIFRDRKIVKLTSPNLNYLIIVGVFILLLGMILYSIPTKDITLLTVICTLRRFFTSFGHDVSFTVALVKTLRIHYIFLNPSPNKRAPKDWTLFMISCGIISIDLVISVILFIPDIIFADVGETEDKERQSGRNDQGITIDYCVPSCGTTIFYLVWVVFTALFKFSLHFAAIILAFRIRNIKVNTLNDFKFSSAIVYTSTILIVILIGVLLAANDFINVFAALVPLLVFLEILVFLLLTFVPKMVALYKDPKGIHVFDKPEKPVNPLSNNDSLKRTLSYQKGSPKGDTGQDSGKGSLDSKDQKSVQVKNGKDIFPDGIQNDRPPPAERTVKHFELFEDQYEHQHRDKDQDVEGSETHV